MQAIADMRAPENAAPDDEPRELLAPMTPAVPTSAPTGPKRLYTRLEAAGWEVWMEMSVVHVGRTYYKGTDRAGEVKSEPHEVRYWQVRARRRQGEQMIAAFLGTWEQKKGCSFVDAFAWDVVGEERVLYTKLKDLDDWLDILAPVASKRKEKAA